VHLVTSDVNWHVKLAITGLIFVDPGVKVSAAYYFNVLLFERKLLRITCSVVSLSWEHARQSTFLKSRLLYSSCQICGRRTNREMRRDPKRNHFITNLL